MRREPLRCAEREGLSSGGGDLGQDHHAGLAAHRPDEDHPGVGAAPSSQERSPLSSAADIQLLLTLRPLPPQRRECPNPRTPYCHYYYNLKEDRQIEMRDMETTVKVAWSVMPTCGQIWQGGGELEGGAVRKFTLPDTASKPFDFYNFRANQGY